MNFQKIHMRLAFAYVQVIANVIVTAKLFDYMVIAVICSSKDNSSGLKTIEGPIQR